MSKRAELKRQATLIENHIMQGFLDANRLNLKQMRVNDHLSQDLKRSIYKFIKSNEKTNTLIAFIENEYDLNVAFEELDIYHNKEKYATFMTGMLYSFKMLFQMEMEEQQKQKTISRFKITSRYSFDILTCIDKHPGIKQKDIASAINVRNNHLSNILKRLHAFQYYYYIEEGREKQFFISLEGKKYLKNVYDDNKYMNKVPTTIQDWLVTDEFYKRKDNYLIVNEYDHSLKEMEIYHCIENPENFRIKINENNTVFIGGKRYE